MQVHQDVLSSYLKMVRLISVYYSQPKDKNKKQVSIYHAVKAMEQIFAPHYQLVSGFYCWVSGLEDNPTKGGKITTCFHSWLSVCTSPAVIIDVVPLCQPSNLKSPIFVMIHQDKSGRHNFGYFPSPKIKISTPKVKLAVDIDNAVDIFEEIMRKQGI